MFLVKEFFQYFFIVYIFRLKGFFENFFTYLFKYFYERGCSNISFRGIV